MIMKLLQNLRASVIAALIAGALVVLSFGVNRGIAQNAGQLIFTPTGQELVQVIPPNTAAIAYVPLAALRDGAQYVYNVPLTGFTIVMTAEQSVVSLNPAGGIATGTITMPPTLYDGKIVTIGSSQAITTTLTLNTSNGATFVPAAPTTLAANVSVSFIYDKANNQWHRFQ
jgi:hypothetical protein